MNELTTTTTVTEAGAVADRYAAQQTFNDYQQRKAKNTLRAQYSDLATFAEYLCAAGVTDCPTADELQNYPEAWTGVTFGLAAGFVRWMMANGLALTSLNRKLSTVKVYASLAAKAGFISGSDLALLQTVKGYAAKEFTKVDEKRSAAGVAVRTGTKKLAPTAITKAQARQLKTGHPDTPQGRRDAVLMTLLLDHGLRVGELVRLQVTDVNLAGKELKFFRPKVDKTQRHTLTPDTFKALKVYINSGDAPAMGPLLRKSLKTGQLGDSGMTELGVNLRVAQLGERVDIDGLGPHDCRHFWATSAMRNGTDPFALLQAGGWTSMQTVQKYVDENVIANAGVKTDE
jgi:site-specific recombinase XerD